ncbi:MAG: hypothetical protein ABI844_17260 [Saprospiraceae bacterium]
MKKYIFFLCLLISLACTRSKIPKEVSNLVEERMQLYYIERDSVCKRVAVKKAEQAVDSFFLSIREQYLHDSIVVPSKPIKPMVDTNITIDETRPVKPLWDSLIIKK